MRSLDQQFTPAVRRDARTRTILDDLRRSIAAAIDEAGTVDALVRIVTQRVPFYLRPFAAPIVRLTLALLAQWVSPDQPDPTG